MATPDTPEIAGVPATGGTEVPHSAMWLGLNAEAYVAVAFLLFVGLLLYFKAPKMVTDALDGHAAKVRDDLAEAKRLRAEAENLLAAHRDRAAAAATDVEHILATARAEARTIVADAHAAADAVIARRTAMAETKIAAAERAAEAAVRGQAVDLATAAARRIIAGRDDPGEANRLTAAAISELDRRLH